MSAQRALLDILFASLWQGILLTGVVAIALRVMGRRINAATRCLILQLTLMGTVVLPIATTAPILAAHPAGISLKASIGSASGVDALPIGPFFFGRRFDVILSEGAVWSLLCAWFAGTIYLSLRIAGGSLRLVRLLRRSTRLHDEGDVRVYACSNVDIPLAIGFWRPAIVVPPTLTTPESSADFKQALLHELAHLERHDSWANAVEHLIQVTLFFNPAVLWLVHAIALERETACDDRAVAGSTDVDTYVRTLATLALQMRANAPAATFGATHFGRSTVARIKRLEDPRRNGATSLSRLSIGGFIVMLLTLALALQSFAPAVAFAPQPVLVQDANASSTRCTKEVAVVNPVAPVLPKDTPHVVQPVSTIVAVRVSSTGSVLGVRLFKSSGIAQIDKATIDAAEASTYSPAMQNCVPIASNYLFNATLKSDGH